MAVCMAALSLRRALNFLRPVMVSWRCMVDAIRSRFCVKGSWDDDQLDTSDQLDTTDHGD